MAAEINAQLEVGTPSTLGFTPVGFVELRQRWLDHHEHVRRSSLQTISRYRTATQHFLDFVANVRPLRRVSDFRPEHAEEFVRYLRSRKVAPNGHRNTAKRTLRDAGIKYILETCSALMNYAQRQRHLAPYVENPFRTIEVCRIPIEDAKPVVALAADEQVRLLEACDPWQFPLYLTLLLTGLRPGELVHLLLPQDLDLEGSWLFVRNKPRLGWQVKTRNERDLPLVPVLRRVLQHCLSGRNSGPVFRQRRCAGGYEPPLTGRSLRQLEHELDRRESLPVAGTDGLPPRAARAEAAVTMWRDLGALKEDRVRQEFIRLTRRSGLEEITTPKTLRHTFATILQDANVDPLVRNELMGHVPMSLGHGISLGMTAIYTHTRPETKWRQLQLAVESLPIIAVAERWLDRIADAAPVAV
jgi:integrase